MRITTRLTVSLLAALTCFAALATTKDLDQELAALDRESEIAKFETPDGDPRVKAFAAVRQHAADLAKQYPQRPEPLVFEAWALIDQSIAVNGLSSLGLLKQARQKLEAALAIDANNGAANSTLGSLYFNVPKWPLSFGDKKKGRAYSQKAIAIDPTSGWQNLDYAKCLFKDEDYSGAVKHATITLQAPTRAGSKRDANMRTEAAALIGKAKEKLR
jgi:tetratricopeptide (TPR) repeat protein